MKFVVKYFSEMALKTSVVRLQFAGMLSDNLRARLRGLDAGIGFNKTSRLHAEHLNGVSDVGINVCAP